MEKSTIYKGRLHKRVLRSETLPRDTDYYCEVCSLSLAPLDVCVHLMREQSDIDNCSACVSYVFIPGILPVNPNLRVI